MKANRPICPLLCEISEKYTGVRILRALILKRFYHFLLVIMELISPLPVDIMSNTLNVLFLYLIV